MEHLTPRRVRARDRVQIGYWRACSAAAYMPLPLGTSMSVNEGSGAMSGSATGRIRSGATIGLLRVGAISCGGAVAPRWHGHRPVHQPVRSVHRRVWTVAQTLHPHGSDRRLGAARLSPVLQRDPQGAGNPGAAATSRGIGGRAVSRGQGHRDTRRRAAGRTRGERVGLSQRGQEAPRPGI